MASSKTFAASRFLILDRIDDDDWCFYIADLLKSEADVKAVFDGTSKNERHVKVYADFPDMQTLGKFCLGSTDVLWREALQRFLGKLNFMVSRETMLRLVPGGHWPQWIAEGLLKVQAHLRATPMLECDIDSAPGNAVDLSVGGWIQMDNMAINFFWHRMFLSRSDVLIEDGVKTLAMQGFHRRDLALRTIDPGTPVDFQQRYADACERGLNCQALRVACGATSPGAREAIWIYNAQLLAL
jgi:hypothetical protein